MSPRRIAVTMGDPCGIGPEVALKALEKLALKRVVPFIIGDAGWLRKEAVRYGIKKKDRSDTRPR